MGRTLDTTQLLTTDDMQRRVIEAQCHRWLVAFQQARMRGDTELARRCAAMANVWLMCFEQSVGVRRHLNKACRCAGEVNSRIVAASQPT